MLDRMARDGRAGLYNPRVSSSSSFCFPDTTTVPFLPIFHFFPSLLLLLAYCLSLDNPFELRYYED